MIGIELLPLIDSRDFENNAYSIYCSKVNSMLLRKLVINFIVIHLRKKN